MKLTIVGATGGVGRHLVEQALNAGHQVTAVVRNARSLPREVRVFVTDLQTPDCAALRSALMGADAVLSGLGARSATDTGVATRGTRAMLEAMKFAAVRRIIVVSAAPIGTVPSPGRPTPPKHDPGDGFFMRHLLAPVIKQAFRGHYADLAAMEDTVRESATDWTVVRPPRLTDGNVTGRYRVAYGENLRRGLVISRADVAHFMLRAIQEPETFRQVVGIAN